MTTADRIRAMLVKDFRITADKITADTPLEDLGVDSIGMAELIFNVEDEFGLKLPDVPVQLRHSTMSFGISTRPWWRKALRQAPRW